MLIPQTLKRLTVETGLLTHAEAELACAPSRPLTEVIERLQQRGLSDDQIAYLLACVLQLPYVPIEQLTIAPQVSARIPVEQQVRYRVVPLHIESDTSGELLYAAMPPERAAAVAIFLTSQLGITVVPVIASESSIRHHLDSLLGKERRSKGRIAAADADLDTPATMDGWRSHLRGTAH